MISRALQMLQDNEIFKPLLESNPDGFLLIDLDGQILKVNTVFTWITGFTESEVVNTPLFSLLACNSIKKTIGYLNRARHGHPDTFEVLFHHRNGKTIDLSVKWIPFSMDQRIIGLYGFIRDITGQKQTESILREIRMRYSLITEHMEDLIKIVNTEGKIIFASPSHKRMLGFAPSHFEWQELVCKVHPHDRQLVADGIRNMAENKSKLHMEYRYHHHNGNWVNIEGVWSPVENKEGDLEAILIVGRDVTERKAMEDRLSFLAHHDPLTGLANRSLIDARLTHAIQSAKEGSYSFAVLFMDLDRFKSVNDSLGHSIGDGVLQQIAHRLLACLPAEATVGRLGGDEFTIILPRIQDRNEAANVASRIMLAFCNHFYIDSYELHLSPSIGISIYPDNGEDESEILRQADIAMYQAKTQGKNSFLFYSKMMDEATSRRFQLENDLYRAIEEREFSLAYQPLIRMRDQAVLGLEALIRWFHPTFGWVSPSEFIPIAEDSGMIVTLGNWVIRSVCEQSKQWHDSGLPPIKLSVNLSARQLLHVEFMDHIREIFLSTGAAPSSISIEITETMMMENIERSIVILQQLKAMGISVSIDDFGTGYSSLNYLQKLPVDALKIDRSFIEGVNTRSQQAELVKAIIVMSHSLHKTVVAEGVETIEQYSFLKQEGCDVVQGFLFSQPLHPREAVSFICKNYAAQWRMGQILTLC